MGDSKTTRRVPAFLRPEEWLCVAFGVLLLALAGFFTGPDYGIAGVWRTLEWGISRSLRRDIPFFSSHLAFFLLLAVATYVFFIGRALIRPAGRSRAACLKESSLEFLGLLRAYVPFLACYAVYVLLRDMIPHLRADVLDRPLAEMESGIFGTLVSTATFRALESDFLTAALAAGYASHFYAPPLVAFLFFVLRDNRNFRGLMLGLVIAGFLSYLGYLLAPAVGPRYTVAAGVWPAPESVQAGGAVLRFVDDWSWRARDCFPSMHTAWAVLTGIYAFRLSKTLFWVYLPFGAGLLAGCLYFGYHYVVDLPAGVIVGAAAFFLANGLHRWWYAAIRDLAPAEDKGDDP